jgi:hypothetical protein
MRRKRTCAPLLLLAALAVTGASAQQVTLPLTQYEDLRTRSQPTPEPAPELPARFAFESADFEVRAGAESARVTQTLRFLLFDDKPMVLPLGEAGAFISADFAGLEGRVDTTNGEWRLAVRGEGRHQVKLESVVGIAHDETSTRPLWLLPIRFPTAGVVRGTLSTPLEVEEVTLDGNGAGWVGKGTGADGGWSFAVLPGADVRFRIAGKAVVPERARLPLRFEATTATATTLTRTRLTVAASVVVRVGQGQLKELRLPLPPGFEVVGVRGPLPDWKVEAGNLVGTFSSPVESTATLEIDLTSPPRESFVTPVLLPQGSARTLLLAKAAVPQNEGLLRLTNPGVARAPEERELAGLPESITKAAGKFFVVRDPAQAPAWEAQWAEGTEVLASQIDRLVVDVGAGEGGRASYQVWAVVRNRGAQQLSFTLPAGFELISSWRDNAQVAAGGTGGTLVIPLLSQDGPQIVHLAGILPLTVPKERATLEIPIPQLSAPAAQVELRVVLPPGRTYTLADPSRAGSVGAPPQAVQRKVENALALRVNSQQSSYTGPGSRLGEPQTWFFFRPPGYLELGASWSALSASPSPVALKVEAGKEKSEWF